MSSFEDIRSIVADDLDSTQQFMVDHLNSSVPLIREVVQYTLSSGGKRIRPLLLLLICKAFSITESDRITLAAILEFIHTATLLHDDVVDDSNLRRGRQTAKMIWGNPASVLVGDFVYARAFQLVSKMNHPRILDSFANATYYLSEGELLQLSQAHHPDIEESTYFTIIHHKTAVLFEMAAYIAILLQPLASDSLIHDLSQFGSHLGLAFQLVDDVLDYTQSPEIMGKTLGQDFSEGKVTLPLIHAIHSALPHDQTFLKKLIEQNQPIAQHQLTKVIQLIESSRAIEYTLSHAERHIHEARSFLLQVPENAAKQALFDLCDFCMTRTF